jgi:predicted Zn finger-like uncharacterized protein
MKLLCAYCQATIVDDRDFIHTGMTVKCPRCEKLTRITVTPNDEEVVFRGPLDEATKGAQ